MTFSNIWGHPALPNLRNSLNFVNIPMILNGQYRYLVRMVNIGHLQNPFLVFTSSAVLYFKTPKETLHTWPRINTDQKPTLQCSTSMMGCKYIWKTSIKFAEPKTNKIRALILYSP